jgi:UDP-N-acetylglucosamine 2-epimerase (non-hydrolysing)
MVEATMAEARRSKVLVVFGTRPEVIKLAPVIRQLDAHARHVETVNVTTAQHTDLLYPFVRFFGIRVDHDLNVMRPSQEPGDGSSAASPLTTSRRPRETATR